MFKPCAKFKRQMKSPIPYFGGKFYMAKHIVPLIPEHHTYVEPFGGGGSILFSKSPSPVEVYNDLDGDVVNFFKVLREQPNELQRLCVLTPYSRQQHTECWKTRHEGDELQRAWKYFVACRMAFSGTIGQSISFAVACSRNGMASPVSKYISSVNNFDKVAKRLLTVQIENQCFEQIFKAYDRPETFFYIDPPYIASTRQGGIYTHEMTDADHERLVKILLGIEGQAILSGYDSPTYEPLTVAGWEMVKVAQTCHAAGRTRASGLQGVGNVSEKQKRTEVLFIKRRKE